MTAVRMVSTGHPCNGTYMGNCPQGGTHSRQRTEAPIADRRGAQAIPFRLKNILGRCVACRI